MDSNSYSATFNLSEFSFSTLKKKKRQLGAGGSYLSSQARSGGLQFQASLGKRDSISMEKKTGMLAHAPHASNGRKYKRGGLPSSQPGQKARPYLQNN
jgi:hypothetical protein